MFSKDILANNELLDLDAVTAAKEMLGRLLVCLPVYAKEDTQNNDFNTPLIDNTYINDPIFQKDSIGQAMVGIITETEAYYGFEDKGAHAFRGITPRNKVMFGPSGKIYVYQIYGMYNCLNIITYKEGIPSGVLIRSIEPISGIDKMVINSQINVSKYSTASKLKKALGVGPGRLCRSLGLTTNYRGLALGEESGIFIGATRHYSNTPILSSPRVNIDYAEESRDLMWRFYLENTEYVTPHKNNRLSKKL